MCAETFEITQGPTQDQLFDSLRNWSENRRATFWIRKDGPNQLVFTAIVVGVNVLTLEEDRSDKWNVKLFDESARLGSKLLDGYYDTNRRTGRLRLVKA